MPLTSHEHVVSRPRANEMRFESWPRERREERGGKERQRENRSLSFCIISEPRERKRERVQSAGRGPLKERRGISRLSSQRARSGYLSFLYRAPGPFIPLLLVCVNLKKSYGGNANTRAPVFHPFFPRPFPFFASTLFQTRKMSAARRYKGLKEVPSKL